MGLAARQATRRTLNAQPRSSSVMGQVCAAAAILVAIALLIPLTWHAALYAFCVWLALAGLTLLVGSRPKARHPQLVP
jgi:hypothetical protein